MSANGVTWAQIAKLARALPDITEETSYGTPALKVRGKLFVRLKEDGASVVFWLESLDEQEFLLQAQPRVYFITDHYRGYPLVLGRLAQLSRAEAELRVRHGWMQRAPVTVRRKLQASEAGATAPRKPAKRKPAKRRS